MLVPIWLGVVHALVDASTVTAILRASRSGPLSPEAAIAVVLGYDILAFGSQVLLGWFTDRYATPRAATLIGLALCAVSLVLYRWNAVATVACAGIGNSLFHLGAGATVLRGGLERAARSGLFVAPGALGLAFGLYYGAQQHAGPVWPLLMLVIAASCGVVWRKDLGAASSQNIVADGIADLRASSLRVPSVYVALGLLLFSIAVRSLVGLSAARGYVRTDLLIIGIPLVAFAGKALGGYVADRFGWVETSVVALILSIPPIVLAPPAAWLLVGLGVFQLTMPVTLTAVARLLPQRLATAFGWTCLALLAGALPTMLSPGNVLCSRPMLGIWIALAAASLYAGLRLSGITSRFEAVPLLAANLEMKQ